LSTLGHGYLDKLIADSERRGNLQEVAKILGEKGLTPEMFDQMLADVDKWSDRISLIFFVAGGVKYVSKKLVQELAEEAVEKGAKKEIFGAGAGKGSKYILQRGTDWFTLTPEAFKDYPKITGVPIPSGQFKLTPKATKDALRDAFDSNVSKEFKAHWKKMNLGKIWKDDWMVHHIKPLKFGGDNEFNNLVPVTKAEHYQLNSFWAKLMFAIAGIGGE
jgi:hypothetical protein